MFDHGSEWHVIHEHYMHGESFAVKALARYSWSGHCDLMMRFTCESIFLALIVCGLLQIRADQSVEEYDLTLPVRTV